MADYEDEITIVEGTFGKDVNLQCVSKKTGEAVDVTGCVVEWRVWLPEKSVLKLKVTCTLVTPAEGKVKYALIAANWTPTGKLEKGEYISCCIATKSGYQEEFKDLLVHIPSKSPDTLET